VLEDDDHAKLVKFGFVREGMSFVNLAADVKNPTDAGLGAEKAGDDHSTALLAEILSDEEIEKLIAERVAARRGGDYARSDEIRANLLKAGVILEDTKAGARWKRK
jgi:cysteinyl-tRNA synthetase